jgi:hypothetical protein
MRKPALLALVIAARACPKKLIQPRSRGVLAFVVWIGTVQSLPIVSAQADLKVLKPTGTTELLISGTITEQDAKSFEALSPELDRSRPWVSLDSIGGDVAAAMKIGRLIRKYEGWTNIEKEPSAGFSFNANCYSSCALIFIAGVHRRMGSEGGQLGLHRPYLASAPQSREVVEKQVPLMLSQVRPYIADMGITENFYQQMVNTEPSQMVVYGDPNTEFRDLNKDLGVRTIVNNWTTLVPEYDPVYQEIETSYDARKYGVTTLEMRRRDNDAEQRCYDRSIGNPYTCVEALRWGLSERVYLERDKQARSCWRDEDVKLLITISARERRDHPVWIKREACIRATMLGRP